LALPVTSAEFLKVELGGASGRWAVEALGRCAGRRACQVFGYPSSELIDRNRSVLAPERDRPAFVFIREPASGMEVALWDCEKVARPDKRECLPEDRDRLVKIMRERVS
jgi:PAS domain-containing protein